eukprot:2758404-Amphidinium_carterae.1
MPYGSGQGRRPAKEKRRNSEPHYPKIGCPECVAFTSELQQLRFWFLLCTRILPGSLCTMNCHGNDHQATPMLRKAVLCVVEF